MRLGHERFRDARTAGLSIAQVGHRHGEQSLEVQVGDDLVQHALLSACLSPLEWIQLGTTGQVSEQRKVVVLSSTLISGAQIGSPHTRSAQIIPSIGVEAHVLDGMVGEFAQLR